MHSGVANLERALLDPDFWKALGKSLMWDIRQTVYICENHTDELWYLKRFCSRCGTKLTPRKRDTENYTKYWHGFIDFLNGGGDPEGYFKQLDK